MDNSTSTRALIVLLGILSDPDLWIGKRLEAAETLLTYECPTDVVDAAKQFLLGVAEGERQRRIAPQGVEAASPSGGAANSPPHYQEAQC